LFPYRRGICRGNVRERQRKPMMNLGELARSAKLETMHLKLKGVRLQLPAAAVFASLVDLSLENIEFTAGSGHLRIFYIFFYNLALFSKKIHV
jgi:hypothetical protein